MGTVPVVPPAKTPIARTMPIVLVLTGAVVLIGASTAYNVISGGHKKDVAKSTLQSRPATADSQQVSSFQKQQALILKSPTPTADRSDERPRAGHASAGAGSGCHSTARI
jgi:hypothetical protein